MRQISGTRLAQLRRYRDLALEDTTLAYEALERDEVKAIRDAMDEVDRLTEVARLAAECIGDESAGSMEFWRAYEPGKHGDDD